MDRCALLGLHEAMRLSAANQFALADSSLIYVEQRLAQWELSRGESSQLGGYYLTMAFAAQTWKRPATVVSLVRRALDYCPEGTPESAECLYLQGEAYQQLERYDDAVRCYKSARDVEEIDPSLRACVEVALAKLQLDLEGRATRMSDSIGAFGAMGLDAEAMVAIADIATKLATGQDLTDEDRVRFIRANLSTPDSRTTPRGRLTAYITILKCALEMENQALVPFNYQDVLQRAEQQVDDEGSSEAQILSQLRAVILDTCETDGEVSVDAIAAVADVNDRIRLLHTVTCKLLADIMTDRQPSTAVPIRDLTELSHQTLMEARRSLLTPESGRLFRPGVEPLVRQVATLAFFHLTSEQDDEPIVRQNIPKTSDEGKLLESLWRLLEAASGWMLDRYTKQPLVRSLKNLPPAEQVEFDKLRVELSEAMDDVFFDVSNVQSQLDRLRELRGLAQVADRSAEVCEEKSRTPDHDCDMVLVALATEPPAVGSIVREDRAYHIWCSMHWGEIAEQYKQIPKDRDVHQMIDKFYRSHVDFAANTMSAACGGLSTASEEFQQIRYRELTGFEVPLAWLGTSATRQLIRRNNGPADVRSDRSTGQVAFWGWSQNSAATVFSIDEATRRLSLCDSDEPLLAFPGLPSDRKMQLESWPTPLPYVHYDRWALQDVCRSTNRTLHERVDASATRQAFLETDWQQFDIVHIATHGQSRAAVPECACLEFGSAAAGGSKATYLDIMALDWSKTRLVFLNTCLSAIGDNVAGEPSLSLAYAFLAGGASAVIATRWKVPDDTAYAFASEFYRRWFAEGTDLEHAFHLTVQSLQKTPRFAAPHDWGAFELLT